MSEQKTLREMLPTTYFRIPDFQRGYAWTAKQLDDLWCDLISIPDNARHYMGTLYVERGFRRAESDRWVEDGTFVGVVDGQQRLTTLAILLFVLVKYSDGRGYAKQTDEFIRQIYICTRECSHPDVASYKFCYDESNNSRDYRDFLMGEIFEENSVNIPSIKSVYAKNLLEAKRFFEDKIKNLDYVERENLFRLVTGRLCFDYREIDGDFDVQMVFETINNRGKPLTTLEKLKNRLMYLSARLNISENLRIRLAKDIKEVWGQIYEQLAADFINPLDEDEFLAAHLSLYRRPKDNVFSEKQSEEKLFQMFANFPDRFDRNTNPQEGKEPSISFEKISRYVNDLGAFLRFWVEIHTKKELVQKILTLNSSREMKILLCAILACNSCPEKQQVMLEFLFKIAFRNSVPGAAFKDQGSFATAARSLYVRKENIDAIEHLEAHEILEEWCKEYDSTPVNLDSVASTFSGLYGYQRGNKGFHRWWWLKFFLFEYEEKLAVNTTEQRPRITLDSYSKTSIEHVMPQAWQTNWGNEMKGFLERIPDVSVHDDARKTIINSLGNLTIIGARMNSALQNDAYSILQGGAWNTEGGKRKFYATEGTYSETKISEVEHWDYHSILKRGSQLLDYLAERLCNGRFTIEQKRTALLYRPEIYNSFRDEEFSYARE